MYQRKVRVTLTRAEAKLVQELLVRAYADADLARQLAVDGTQRQVADRARNAWRKVYRAVDRRDEAMRKKVYLAEAGLDELDSEHPSNRINLGPGSKEFNPLTKPEMY